MARRKSNDREKSNDIILVVTDENDLYISFSPEDEFKDGLKNYMKSKIGDADYKKGIAVTVISSTPIDEERFRSAGINWIRDEREIIKREKRRNIRSLIGMLLIATVFIILSLVLEEKFSVISLTIIPVLGSVALGSAAAICIKELPVNFAKLKFLEKIKENSTIVFKQSE